MITKSAIYDLATHEGQILCLCCADDRGIEANSSISAHLYDNPNLFELLCDGCHDTLWDSSDAIVNANPYDTDDFGPPDSDPHEGDRDEYEPGGCYFDRETEEPPARHTIHGWTGPDGRVQARHWTNDNLDRGYPTEDARWTTTYPTVERFRETCGYTRQGMLCYVEVWLDGRQQFEPEEMARLDRVEDLGKHLSDELTRLLGEFPGATFSEVAAAIARMAPVEVAQ